jgi:hypothetical protein
MPADGGAVEADGILLREQDAERERVGKTNIIKLRGRRKRGYQVAALDSTLEVRMR